MTRRAIELPAEVSLSLSGYARALVEVTVGPEETPGKRTVFGYTTPSRPGLAITATESSVETDKPWTVTHVATGRAIVGAVSWIGASKVVAAIAGLADWTKPEPKVSALELVDHLRRASLEVVE